MAKRARVAARTPAASRLNPPPPFRRRPVGPRLRGLTPRSARVERQPRSGPMLRPTRAPRRLLRAVLPPLRALNLSTLSFFNSPSSSRSVQASHELGLALYLLTDSFNSAPQAFEGSFYREGLKKFGLVEMMNAGLSRLQALIMYASRSSDLSTAASSTLIHSLCYTTSIEQIQIIIVDEQNHFDALSSALVALGAKPPAGCGFDFSKALSDVSTDSPARGDCGTKLLPDTRCAPRPQRSRSRSLPPRARSKPSGSLPTSELYVAAASRPSW